MPFLETNSPVSDSCDESLTSNVQDISSIINRPPLPPIPTTRTLHIPDPDSVLQYISSCSHRIPTATKTIRKTPIPTSPKNTPIPSTSQTPIKTIPEHTTNSPSDISSFTFSQLYPKLKRPKSTTTSSLTDLYHKDKDSDSTASTRVPKHSYNLISQQRRFSQDLSSFFRSSTNSRLVRQQAQPRSDTASLSSSHPTIPSYHYHFKSHQDLKQHPSFQKTLKLYQIVQQTFHAFIHLVQYYLTHRYNHLNTF